MSTITPAQYGLNLKSRYDNFIGGRWLPPVNGRYFENLTPVTGKALCEIARSDEADIELALDAAHAAKAAWGKTSVAQRALILNRVADRMEQNLQAIAEAEARYRELFRDSPAGLFRSGIDGSIIEVNPAMARMMAGYVLFATLRHARDIPWFEQAQRRGEWAYRHPRSPEDTRVAVLGRLVHSLALYGAVEAVHLGAELHLLDALRPDRQRAALAARAWAPPSRASWSS